jgi:hypothetical protein
MLYPNHTTFTSVMLAWSPAFFALFELTNAGILRSAQADGFRMTGGGVFLYE